MAASRCDVQERRFVNRVLSANGRRPPVVKSSYSATASRNRRPSCPTLNLLLLPRDRLRLTKPIIKVEWPVAAAKMFMVSPMTAVQ